MVAKSAAALDDRHPCAGSDKRAILSHRCFEIAVEQHRPASDLVPVLGMVVQLPPEVLNRICRSSWALGVVVAALLQPCYTRHGDKCLD